MKKEKKFANGINAGSMADVAFLMLIFFLVVTTIDVDKGITVQLPPWCEDCPGGLITPKNLFSVRVNSNDEIMIRGEQTSLESIRERAKAFIGNNGADPDLSDKPTKALIALQNDRNTSYETYLAVYNELKAAYNELWNEESFKTFGQPYKDLSQGAKREIRTKIPLVISESEPSDHAGI